MDTPLGPQSTYLPTCVPTGVLLYSPTHTTPQSFYTVSCIGSFIPSIPSHPTVRWGDEY